MGDQESQTKFDHLVSVKSLYCNSHSLSQVPSVRNMAKLEELYLHSNKITMIRADDFAGATSLLMLKLDNNGIVSVAASKDVTVTKRIKRQWVIFLRDSATSSAVTEAPWGVTTTAEDEPKRSDRHSSINEHEFFPGRGLHRLPPASDQAAKL